MIWSDPGFKDLYSEKLRHAHANSEVELRAQAQAFQAEAVQGGTSPEKFFQRASAAAAATLSGYVRDALDAFDGALAGLEAELEDADLVALRESLEKEIAQRAKLLPSSLRDFSRPATHPALLRTVVQDAPVKARALLAEHVASSRERLHARVHTQELLDRAIFIGHDPTDAAVAEALKAAIMEAVGSDARLYTSSALDGIRAGRARYERVLTQLKKNRMMLAIATPRSSSDPWLWWATGLTAGFGKPVFVLRAGTLGTETTLPVNPVNDVDLSRREDVVRLLQAIQGEMRRRASDPQAMDLDDLMRRARLTF